MRLLVILLALHVVLMATQTIKKSATISNSLHSNKSANELKQIALRKAKLEAAKEIYGEFLLSETVMLNGQIVDDIIRQKHGGVVHISGEPQYIMTSNSTTATINAYATKEELQEIAPHKIVMKDFYYSNPELPLKDLKQAAEDAFILEAISRKKPSVKDIKEARRLALEVEITKIDFNVKTLDYIVDGSVTYIPIFLRHSDSITQTLFEENIIQERQRRDFFGSWSGFIMDSRGNSSSVEVIISSFAQSVILYKSLKCGGDLIITNKTPYQLSFKEVLTFGKDRCENSLEITLQKLTPTSLQFTQKDNGDELFKGVVYFRP
ncbi:MAG: hypothetical protein U9N42_11750 [Campylobacterota bacterium]|nr:hypothetical protein [Campylobacterota bacterium]